MGPALLSSRPHSGPRRLDWRRLVLHIAATSASAALAGAILVWPQWVVLDGSRNALAVQQSREHELNDRLANLRLLSGRLRDWKRAERRVLLLAEVANYARQVRATATQEGAVAAAVEVTDRPSSRWRAARISALGLEEAVGDQAGEIQPRAVRIVLRGTFSTIYRTIAALTTDQWIFVPDRWDIAAGETPRTASSTGTPAETGQLHPLRAEVWATVFLAREPETAPVVLPARRAPQLARANFGGNRP